MRHVRPREIRVVLDLDPRPPILNTVRNGVIAPNARAQTTPDYYAAEERFRIARSFFPPFLPPSV